MDKCRCCGVSPNEKGHLCNENFQFIDEDKSVMELLRCPISKTFTSFPFNLGCCGQFVSRESWFMLVLHADANKINLICPMCRAIYSSPALKKSIALTNIAEALHVNLYIYCLLLLYV